MASSSATLSGSMLSRSFLILLTHLPGFGSFCHFTGTLVCPCVCLKVINRAYISFQGMTFLLTKLQSKPVLSNHSIFCTSRLSLFTFVRYTQSANLWFSFH